MTGVLTPLVWATAALTSTVVYRRIHPPGKPLMRYEIASAVIAYTVLIVMDVGHDHMTTDPIDVDDVARLMGLRLTRLLLATDVHDPNHLTPAGGPSSKNGHHPDVVTDEIRAIINRTKGDT